MRYCFCSIHIQIKNAILSCTWLEISKANCGSQLVMTHSQAVPVTLNHFKREIANDTSIIAGPSFDYIVAGDGPTGLTVAGLLSEDASVTVFVIEQGS